jgi:glycosyltransferase involved in cell wall biosynthesis
VIPNPVPEDEFVLRDRSQARSKLGIPESKRVVLFVANDISNARKGIASILSAIARLESMNLMVCTVGKPLPDKPAGIELREFGFIASSAEMAAIYACADVFVLPSQAENFPNTIIEALFCGVPVVAARVGGIPEQVNALNGMLADDNSAESLSSAICTVLEAGKKYDPEAIRADAVKRFGKNNSVQAYIAVYRQLYGAR